MTNGMLFDSVEDLNDAIKKENSIKNAKEFQKNSKNQEQKKEEE